MDGQSPKWHNNTMTLVNLTDGTTLNDTLHRTASETQSCSSKTCCGSIIDPMAGVSTSTLDTQLADLRDFLQQFYESKKSVGSKEHISRVAQAEESLQSNGTYTHTVEELEFGSKTAWRNAAKCIGRMHWKTLKLFDGRHTTKPSEMFEILMEHLKYATNAGNVRPAITIFPPKVEGHEYQCLNSQMVQYAGYRKGNQIIGDPASADITYILQQLGWKGKGGRFDLLPLLLQADGKDLEWFEIPPELIMEVDIAHPELDCFNDLGLKWYALPLVANMKLELGGLEYTACPFNGWYMGTEVAARDLCDEQRYNLLTVIARAMQLNTTQNNSLWKDRALLEVNVAVLHSYQKARVTMTDHHTASEAFMQHYVSEVATRGGCPSDWVWIVPPISGSVCPVFHQEMVRYTLKPSYSYQPKAWTYNRYGRPCLWSDVERFNAITIRISFSTLARCIMSLFSLQKPNKPQTSITILYGTETGRSLIFSKQLAATLKIAGFLSIVKSMSEYDATNLEHEHHLLFITSTFGSGDPPQNAKEFYNTLQNMANPDFTKLNYSVLALGSSVYPDFCQFGKDLDHHLSEHGATCMCKVHEADEMKGQDSVFKKWSNSVLNYITGKQEEKTVFRCRFIHDRPITPSNKVLSILHDTSIKFVAVKRVRELQAKGTSPRYFDIRFRSERSQKTLDFHAGDHLQIHPGNRSNDVKMVLSKLEVTPIQHKQPLFFEYFNAETKEWLPDACFPEAVSMTQLLTWFLDIMAPVSEEFIHDLKKLPNEVNHITNDISNYGLNNIVTGAPKEIPNGNLNGQKNNVHTRISNGVHSNGVHSNGVHSNGVLSNRSSTESNNIRVIGEELPEPISYLDVLQMVEPNSIPPEIMIQHIPFIKPRKYSLSTDSLYEKKLTYEITFKEIVFTRNGIQRKGLATGYMTGIPIGHKIHVSIARPLNFQLSMAADKPVLMIAQGTGISPFRAFWRHKYSLRQNKTTAGRTGPLHLFYGCRNPDIDMLYQKEIFKMKAIGILDSVTMAYSREKCTPKTYVQHLITQNTDNVGRIVYSQDGFVFYCGDVNNWDEVCSLLTKAVKEFANLSQQMAEQYIIQMKGSSRLTRDIFMD